jgi:hypothetical protein
VRKLPPEVAAWKVVLFYSLFMHRVDNFLPYINAQCSLHPDHFYTAASSESVALFLTECGLMMIGIRHDSWGRDCRHAPWREGRLPIIKKEEQHVGKKREKS